MNIMKMTEDKVEEEKFDKEELEEFQKESDEAEKEDEVTKIQMLNKDKAHQLNQELTQDKVHQAKSGSISIKVQGTSS
nr:hypothetical protein [Mycoplasmopsis bovis]